MTGYISNASKPFQRPFSPPCYDLLKAENRQVTLVRDMLPQNAEMRCFEAMQSPVI